MIDLLTTIEKWLANGEQVAVATVVRVIGSAPRPVGARLIVSSGGRMAGSVSGGCVETTVYGEMREVLAGGMPRLLRFGITEDMIWDVGLACGGTIEVLVHRLDPALVRAARRCLESGEPFALATVIAGQAGVGDWALITGNQILGPGESWVASLPLDGLWRQPAVGRVHTVAPGVELFIEPFLPPPTLIIIGAVHVAIPLSRFARELGFRVVVTDPRATFASRERFPDADQVLVAWPDEALARLPVDRSTYLVLLTHDPKIDEPALATALKTEAAYIGAIGSRKTHAQRFERMARWGITAEELQRVYAPIGLDLGGQTPEETALSIIAEVVAVKNGRQGGFLRQAAGPISPSSDGPGVPGSCTPPSRRLARQCSIRPHPYPP